VTEPEDRDPDSSEQREVWLPPRLRGKLGDRAEEHDDEEFLKVKESPLGLIVFIGIILGCIAILWGMIWLGHRKEKAEADKEFAAQRAVVVADSMAKVRAADSLAAIKRADSLAFAALPKSQQKKILAEKAKAEKAAAAAANPPAPKPAPAAPAKGATAAAAKAAGDTSGAAATPAPPREHGPYAIDAGEYVDQGKANSVADDLKAKTKLAAQVTALDGGTFHVLLGKFASRGAAESKANALMGKGLIEQGGVIPIPKPAPPKPEDAKPAG
jgi:hypothetical protein